MFTSLITFTLYLATFLIPLVFTTWNYELFEFPKFIILTAASLFIFILMVGDHILNKKNPLTLLWQKSKTPQKLVHTSVIAILLTQALSTITSINVTTSLIGYYSRFHQGLYATICYTIIYFAAVLYLNKKSSHNIIKISITSSFFVCVYAILEHFGIDKNVWVQDVQNRVFSTLGQPNWLAAYIIPNMFLVAYSYYIKKHQGKNQPVLHFILFATLFIALLYTKSRSGLLAVFGSLAIYITLMLKNFSFAKSKKSLIATVVFIVTSILIIGTPWSPNIKSLIQKQVVEEPTVVGPAMETGGTESGEIRKIVWTGALELVKKYPILGTGPETFAYSYYNVRPISHNYVSEWDFLYNKAHNEYLNIAATTGVVGLLGYLSFHLALMYLGFQKAKKLEKKVGNDDYIYLLAYYPVIAAVIVSFFVTNFFGFSVIPVYFLTTLIAAIASTLTKQIEPQKQSYSEMFFLTLFLAVISLYFPIKLYVADQTYTEGKNLVDKGEVGASIPYLEKAISLCSSCDLYLTTLSESYASLAVAVKNNDGVPTSHIADANKYTNLLIKKNSIHLNNLKSATKVYLTLASIDSSYYSHAASMLEQARLLAPTDPKLAYNLGLVYTRMGQTDRSITQFKDAISLRKTYAEAYYALTLVLEESKKKDEIPQILQNAKENLATYSSELKQKIDKYTGI